MNAHTEQTLFQNITYEALMSEYNISPASKALGWMQQVEATVLRIGGLLQGCDKLTAKCAVFYWVSVAMENLDVQESSLLDKYNVDKATFQDLLKRIDYHCDDIFVMIGIERAMARRQMSRPSTSQSISKPLLFPIKPVPKVIARPSRTLDSGDDILMPPKKRKRAQPKPTIPDAPPRKRIAMGIPLAAPHHPAKSDAKRTSGNREERVSPQAVLLNPRSSIPSTSSSSQAAVAIDPPGITALAKQPAVLQTLSQLLSSGLFFDTKFIVCSRLKNSNNRGAVQFVYAQTNVLEAISPNLSLKALFAPADKLFLGGGGSRGDWTMKIVEEYEYYESDSDLDEGEDRNSNGDMGIVEPRDIPILVPIEPLIVANVVYVKDTAYKTLRALVYYCYTGQITFSPLKSTNDVVERLPSDGRDNRCSPKSMYRLAHKLGIKALETSALAAIRDHLSKNNILDELFSSFTSKYPVVQEMEMRILMTNRSQPDVVQALPKMMEKISQGMMPHAWTVLSNIMQELFQYQPPEI
ncbi:hypothetical protein BJ138DRAFT_1107281 [Hygrophoropsis aurantiaca]|uniref:Uncharacterized protein n=1 Tax=Hygrophoropsis aurantiaca TaxID=72124 RepID=A0ACB7ZSS4_9AGAM|nr:hypothetical protein BJ138DRAFT_1107281 [Hygrophoropsis aurantiaca]